MLELLSKCASYKGFTISHASGMYKLDFKYSMLEMPKCVAGREYIISFAGDL